MNNEHIFYEKDGLRLERISEIKYQVFSYVSPKKGLAITKYNPDTNHYYVVCYIYPDRVISYKDRVREIKPELFREFINEAYRRINNEN